MLSGLLVHLDILKEVNRISMSIPSLGSGIGPDVEHRFGES